MLLLWRQPSLATAAGAGGLSVPAPPAQGPRKRKLPPPPQYAQERRVSGTPAARAAVSAPVASVAVAAPAVAGVESEVQNSLDTLKDKLFRLELRRQAGTITEEDYARERARTEAILLELVRG